MFVVEFGVGLGGGAVPVCSRLRERLFAIVCGRMMTLMPLSMSTERSMKGAVAMSR